MSLTDWHDRTALRYASEEGHGGVVQLLVAVVPAPEEWLFELESGETVKIEEGMTQRQINSILGHVIGPIQLHPDDLVLPFIAPSMCPITVRSEVGSFAFDGNCRLRKITGRR